MRQNCSYFSFSGEKNGCCETHLCCRFQMKKKMWVLSPNILVYYYLIRHSLASWKKAPAMFVCFVLTSKFLKVIIAVEKAIRFLKKTFTHRWIPLWPPSPYLQYCHCWMRAKHHTQFQNGQTAAALVAGPVIML